MARGFWRKVDLFIQSHYFTLPLYILYILAVYGCLYYCFYSVFKGVPLISSFTDRQELDLVLILVFINMFSRSK